MREVANLFSTFKINIVAKVLADSPDSALSLANGLLIASSSHVKINFDVGYKLHPEVGGKLGISIRHDRGGKTVA